MLRRADFMKGYWGDLDCTRTRWVEHYVTATPILFRHALPANNAISECWSIDSSSILCWKHNGHISKLLDPPALHGEGLKSKRFTERRRAGI